MIFLDYFITFSPNGEGNFKTDLLVELISTLGAFTIAIFVFYIQRYYDRINAKNLKKELETDKLIYLVHLLEQSVRFAETLSSELKIVANSIDRTPYELPSLKVPSDFDISRIVNLNQEEYFHAYKSRIGNIKIQSIFDIVHFIYGSFLFLKSNFESHSISNHRRQIEVRDLFSELKLFLSKYNETDYPDYTSEMLSGFTSEEANDFITIYINAATSSEVDPTDTFGVIIKEFLDPLDMRLHSTAPVGVFLKKPKAIIDTIRAKLRALKRYNELYQDDIRVSISELDKKAENLSALITPVKEFLN